MMNSAIKICGLTRAADLAAAARAGATHVGFVFFASSPRHLTDDAARSLGREPKRGLSRVILVVDEDDATIAAAIDAIGADMIQLHGSETPARVGDIRRQFGRPVIKAGGISTSDDVKAFVGAYESVADWLLFDARPPKDADRPGGLGIAFDWRLLSGLNIAKPFILSGGLTPDNVARAIAVSGARAVDVSSGVELRPGHKDETLIAEFVRAARRALDIKS